MKRESYQMARMTGVAQAERDRLVQLILDSVRELHWKRLLRFGDLVVDQEESGPSGAESDDPTNAAFFLINDSGDYRLQITLAVRMQDR